MGSRTIAPAATQPQRRPADAHRMSTLGRVLWFLAGTNLLALSVRIGHPEAGQLGYWYVLGYAYATLAAVMSLSAIWTRELRNFSIGLAAVALFHEAISIGTTPG